MKTILIIGASSGVGEALAKRLRDTIRCSRLHAARPLEKMSGMLHGML
jgi:NAD(P)-dependent dehydrogenase (short-subunit alcohol dehydrogenase family)